MVKQNSDPGRHNTLWICAAAVQIGALCISWFNISDLSEPHNVPPIRILIVDDHELVRRGVRTLLTSRLDFEVCGEAADGVQGVDKAKELRPDIVLMDITMPSRNGLDATRLIRAALPNTEVILVSQNESSVVQRQAVEVDARAFVAKSNIANDLIPAIDRVTQNRRHEPAPPATKAVFGDSAMSRLVAQHDWSKTSLGPIQSWPPSLKSAVNLMLNSQHPMWVGWGPETTFLYNDAYISVLSLAKHPWALGRPMREVWAEIWGDVGVLVEKVYAKGEPSYVDNLRLFMSRGDRLEETYYSFSYSPIFDESGKVAGLFCPSSERTANTLNARRLRTLSELSANSLLEKSTDAACATFLATLANNPDDIPFALLYLMEPGAIPSIATLAGTIHVDHNVQDISPRRISLDSKSPGTLWPLDKVIAFSKAEILRIPPHDALPHGAADQSVREAIILPIASPAQLTPLGFLICGVNPTRNLDSEYLTFFSLVVDQLVSAINNARATEDEKRRTDTLTELDRAKTVFFSNISHEFRTPITLMLGPIEELLASQSGPAPDESRRLLSVVHRNGLRLQKMVNALLDFSRLEAGRIQANFEPTDLARLTRDLASGFRSTIERGGLKYEVHCDPLPEPVYVDRDMWEKIVLNLISNAFKFSFEGKIEVRLRAEGEQVILTVSDTGVGVAQSELPRLFERFHRIEGSKARTHEGSGIGLALVQELVRMHHGEIAATSELGRGTTFSIAIPFGAGHLPDATVRDAGRGKADDTSSPSSTQSTIFADEMAEWLPEGPGSVAVSMRSAATGRDAEIRILVADDNSDMREYVARLLGARWTVETVADGLAALESIRKRAPTLVVTDVMMPQMDGFELLREIRNDPYTRRIPVVMLSARAGEESRVEGLEAGADDYIVKPFTARELVARVAARLDLHRLGTLLERERSAIDSLFQQTPLPIAVLTGPDVVYSVANRAYREVVGNRDVVGKPILEALPELKGQGFDTLAREVMRTGKAYVGHESLVRLDRRRTGQLEDTYFTFIYSPISGEGGENHSVAVIATDVTDQVRARRQLEILADEASSGQEKFRKLSESLDAEVRARTEQLEARNAENVEQAEQLRDLSVRLLIAQDDERRRLARELHDSSGQVLSVLSMNLAILARNSAKAGQETKNADLIRESLELVTQISQDIRTTSYLLHPPMLDETGLVGALRWYIDGLVERGGIDIRLNIPEDFERQPREVELVIFRVVQEALTNVHRHSGSKTAVIDLKREGDTIHLSIQDQGRGIAPEKLASIRTKGSGVGFRGMNERVRQLKGKMQVQSGDGGTRITVTLPAQN
jgi:signal transduction histidine kinase/DNA-binding response OmpR family regulator